MSTPHAPADPSGDDTPEPSADPVSEPSATTGASGDPIERVVNPPRRGYVLAPDEGVPGREDEVKASAISTGGSLAIYRTVVDGQGPPTHEHTSEDETIIVVDGTIEVECGSDTWSGGEGTTFFMPRGLPHTFRSLDGPATILFLITPGHLDEFFRLREFVESDDDLTELVSRFF